MAEEAAEKEGEAASEDAAAKTAKSGRKLDTLIVVIIGILVIVLTPLLTFMAVKKAAPEPTEEKPEKMLSEAGSEFMIELKPINVNIHGTKGTRFLRIEAVLVVSEQRLLEELNASIPLLTDRVILAASRRTIDELEGPKGRES
ncbi:MAG: flagellar basal body-associated FliL family protein, partial [Clostridia bacterium]|nr:flagellar basal body-associated FliL family protein [Clostridia bacterium]